MIRKVFSFRKPLATELPFTAKSVPSRGLGALGLLRGVLTIQKCPTYGTRASDHVAYSRCERGDRGVNLSLLPLCDLLCMLGFLNCQLAPESLSLWRRCDLFLVSWCVWGCPFVLLKAGSRPYQVLSHCRLGPQGWTAAPCSRTTGVRARELRNFQRLLQRPALYC